MDGSLFQPTTKAQESSSDGHFQPQASSSSKKEPEFALKHGPARFFSQTKLAWVFFAIRGYALFPNALLPVVYAKSDGANPPSSTHRAISQKKFWRIVSITYFLTLAAFQFGCSVQESWVIIGGLRRVKTSTSNSTNNFTTNGSPPPPATDNLRIFQKVYDVFVYITLVALVAGITWSSWRFRKVFDKWARIASPFVTDADKKAAEHTWAEVTLLYFIQCVQVAWFLWWLSYRMSNGKTRWPDSLKDLPYFTADMAYAALTYSPDLTPIILIFLAHEFNSINRRAKNLIIGQNIEFSTRTEAFDALSVEWTHLRAVVELVGPACAPFWIPSLLWAASSASYKLFVASHSGTDPATLFYELGGTLPMKIFIVFMIANTGQMVTNSASKFLETLAEYKPAKNKGTEASIQENALFSKVQAFLSTRQAHQGAVVSLSQICNADRTLLLGVSAAVLTYYITLVQMKNG